MEIDLSSIRMELPGMGGAEAAGTASDKTDAKPKLASNRQEKATDFIAMLTLTLSYPIPWIHVQPSTGVQTNTAPGTTFAPHYSFCLGTGAFSFVEMHALTDEHTFGGKTYRAGHLVALKRYPLAMDARDDGYNVRSECYDFIRSELRVATRLQGGHDNICQLLFIGWEDHTPVPVLGFEFAHYGTAKDVLRSPDFTKESKFPNLALGLVLDIVRGLDALHKRGIVHGDVKPGNVLVFHHAQQQVVAKLADFSGSIVTVNSRGDKWCPVGGTHVWRAPECYGSTRYDVFKTDVYSFGLTALTILARAPPPQQLFSSPLRGVGECFLARVPEDVDPVEFATAIKCSQDDLVLKHASSWAESFLDDPDLSDFTEWMLQSTVRIDPAHRLSMGKILDRASKELLALSGHPTSAPNGDSDFREKKFNFTSLFGARSLFGNEESDDGRTVVDANQLMDPRIQSAKFHFQYRVFNALKAAAQPAIDVEFTTTDIDSSGKVDKSHIGELMGSNLTVAKYNGHTPEAVQRALLAAHRVADSLVNTGFGTRRDVKEGLRYLSVSGRTGRLLSVLFFTIIDQALDYDRSSIPAPRLLWLILSASGGYQSASSFISNRHPKLVDITRSLILGPGGVSGRAIRSRGADFDDPEEEVLYLQHTSPDNLPSWYHYRSLGTSALCHAAAFGCPLNLIESLLAAQVNEDELELALLMAVKGGYGLVARCLLEHGAKGSAVDHKEQATALHYLAFVRADFVGDLAKVLITNNGSSQLSALCANLPPISCETMSSFGGSPMHCAVVTNNRALAVALIELHKSSGTPIIDFASVLEGVAGTHQEPVLSALIDNAAVLSDSGAPLSAVQLSALLSTCLEGINIVNMGMHLGNCWQAQQESISTLLAAGADPNLPGMPHHDAFDVAIRGDLLDSLKKLIAYAEGKGVDPKAIFLDIKRFRGKTAIETSIGSASWNVFNYLLDNKICVLDDASASGDQNILHISATIGDVRFINRILEAGVSLLQFTKTGYRPFDLAIVARNYDYAKALCERLSESDRQKIIGTDDNGFPTFSRLVYAARTSYRQVVDMEAIRLLDSLGALSVYYNEKTQDTLVRELARTAYSYTRPDSATFDNSLLKLMIDRSPVELLNQRDELGIAPLHYMILNANLFGVALLLEHPGVDINITANPPEGRDLGFKTDDMPLDFAAQVRHAPDPRHAVRGGSREVAMYRANVEGIINLLQRKGAKESSGYFQTMMLKDILGIPDALKLSYLYSSQATAQGRRWRGPERWVEDGAQAGIWPMKLGHGVDNVAELVQPEDDEDELGGLCFV